MGINEGMVVAGTLSPRTRQRLERVDLFVRDACYPVSQFVMETLIEEAGTRSPTLVRGLNVERWSII